MKREWQMQVRGKAPGWEMRWIFLDPGCGRGKQAGGGAGRWQAQVSGDVGRPSFLSCSVRFTWVDVVKGAGKDLRVPILEGGGFTQAPHSC